ncbi:ABC transporter substrate-binding protein [Paenibacillus sp. SYP-B4298]|uniref:ABC transporter substrate-binding protein n=1 Tax=Paenibacillus sp. SYP-B4298 TaxID=2996034 RepID=UPI0022DD8A75|nr:extracellular solute-binding protein [Paenibacillus sp. SYP-B4298]
MKRSVWGSFLVAAICLLPSCLSASGIIGDQEGSGSLSAVEVKQEQPQVTLRYSSYLLDTAQAGRTYYKAIEEFEALYPNIKIETDFIQNTYYTAGIKARLLGGEKLDVFDTWSPSLFNEFLMLGEHIYLDLTSSEFLKDFLPSSLEPVTIGGKIYGVPEVMHSDGLIYNQTLFEGLGLEVPQTWEAFMELCETLRDQGIIPVALDSEWWVPQFIFGSILSSNGADAAWTAKLESGEVKASDPIFVDAMVKTKQLVTRGYIPEQWLSLKHEQSKDLIGKGKAAMIAAGTWDVPSLMERNPNMELGFMIVPGDERAVPNINIGTYRVINATTAHPEEAKQFVAFMNGRVNQEKLALGALAVPSVVNYEAEHPSIEKLAAVVTRQDAVTFWPHSVSTETLQVKILEGVNQYLLGAELEEALAIIQQAIDDARQDVLER